MKKIKTITIIIINTVILLILVELTLRIFFPKKNILQESSLAYQYDPDYLISLKPNMKKEFVRSQKNGGDVINWKTNQHGFRGNDFERKDLTVVVYGDSNIQARFSTLENTYAKKLEKYLQEKTQKSISIINAGVVGYGPDQGFLKFEKEKEKIKPDIVILNIFADNDFGDLLRNRLIKLNENEELTFSSSKKPIDPIFDSAAKNSHKWYHLRTKDAIRKLRDDFLGNPSLLPENVIKTYSRVCQEEFNDYKNNSNKIYSNFADHYDIDIAVNPQSESSVLKINLMEALIEQFNRIAKNDNIDFIVLIQPSSIDVSNNFLINHEDILKSFPKYKNDNLTSIVHEICMENKINSINLYDSFVKEDPSIYYFVDRDSHWNDLGQDKAAKITTTYLLKEIINKTSLYEKNEWLHGADN